MGLDYSERMVELTRRRVGEDDRVSFLTGDARDLSRFRATPFDLVGFSFNGIDSVGHDDRSIVLAEIASVLVPVGWLLFSGHSIDALPLASPLPRPELRDPLRTAFRFARQLPDAATIRRTNAELDLEVARRQGWVVIPDTAYVAGMDMHYISATSQVPQLKALGFEVCEVSDRAGRPVDPRRPGRDAWPHYLCRKPA